MTPAEADQELIDLVAAHGRGPKWTSFIYPPIGTRPYCAISSVAMTTCDCVTSMEFDSHPAHVASVVQQHINERIAKANAHARARVRAANKRASIRITQIRTEEAARFEAEATVARVEALADRAERHGSDIETSDLRTALEGEK